MPISGATLFPVPTSSQLRTLCCIFFLECILLSSHFLNCLICITFHFLSLQYAAGAKAEVIGKPSAQFFLSALAQICVPPNEVRMEWGTYGQRASTCKPWHEEVTLLSMKKSQNRIWHLLWLSILGKMTPKCLYKLFFYNLVAFSQEYL